MTCGGDDEGHFRASLVPEDLALEVFCKDPIARIHPASCRVICTLHVNSKDMTVRKFEHFAGAVSAQKWKNLLRILPGQMPECPQGVQCCRKLLLFRMHISRYRYVAIFWLL